jgi:hypothetical protein
VSRSRGSRGCRGTPHRYGPRAHDDPPVGVEGAPSGGSSIRWVIGRSLCQSGHCDAPAVPPEPAPGEAPRGDQAEDGRARLGDGLDRDRPEQAVRIAIQPGGEKERVRRTRGAPVTEAQGPEFGRGKRLTRVECDRAFECSGRQVIGIDLRKAGGVRVVVADEQVAAKLTLTGGRDGEPPGGVQMHARRIVDQRLDEGTVRDEFVHDAAPGRLVGEGDEEGLYPVDTEILDIERGIAGREARRIRGGETPGQRLAWTLTSWARTVPMAIGRARAIATSERTITPMRMELPGRRAWSAARRDDGRSRNQRRIRPIGLRVCEGIEWRIPSEKSRIYKFFWNQTL